MILIFHIFTGSITRTNNFTIKLYTLIKFWKKAKCTVSIEPQKEDIVPCSTGCKNKYRKYQGSYQQLSNQRGSHLMTRSNLSRVENKLPVNRLTLNNGFPKANKESNPTYSKLATLRMSGKTSTSTNFPKTQSSKLSELKTYLKDKLNSRTHRFLAKRRSLQKP